MKRMNWGLIGLNNFLMMYIVALRDAQCGNFAREQDPKAKWGYFYCEPPLQLNYALI